VPNAWAHPAWGKLLFASCDLAVGAQIHSILLERRVPRAVARGCAGAWLFNPLSLNVSTRGNAESVVLVLLLASLHALLKRRAAAAGTLLAMAMHMKPYPIIYVPAFLASLDADYGAEPSDGLSNNPTRGMASAAADWFSVGEDGEDRCGSAAGSRRNSGSAMRAAWIARFAFLTALGGVSLVLFAGCWAWCGEVFYQEALLHHITRQDVRHNFSPYFYALLLSPPEMSVRSLLSSLAFVPQVTLLVALAARFGRDLPFCMFVQTLVFVSFNKVCTAQYFIWYHALLPLVLPSSAAMLRAERARSFMAAAVWVLTLVVWLGVAWLLEFRAVNVFLPMWISGLAFFAANVFIVYEAIRLHHSTPLFRGGRLARQACLYGAEATGDHATAAGLFLQGLRSLDGTPRKDSRVS